MVNLLTLFEKKLLSKEYKKRLIVVSLFALSLLFAFSIILLIPSYILSSEKYNNVFKQLVAEKKKIFTLADGKDPIKITKDVNNKLSILKKANTSLPAPYHVTVTIIKHKPKGIFIKSILYDKNGNEEKITVSGISENRETLLLFLKSMESETEFSSVELPISSFVKGENIDFSLRVTIGGNIKKENVKK